MSGIKTKLLLKNDLEINITGNSARFNHKNTASAIRVIS